MRDKYGKKICLDDCIENSVPEEVICFECKKKSLKRILLEQYYICANCGKHLKIDPYIRIKLLTDLNSFVELFDDVREKKSVKMAEYQIKLNKAREKSEFQEAVVTGTARIDGKKLALAIMDVDFLMGTLGYVVGEKLALITEYATRHNMPLVIFSCSGGARVQERITSLMQMEKVSMLLNLHDKKGLLYISVLLNPTAGGVAASFAMLGDINIAEPGAMIGFTGRRVIEQTIRKELPANFQTAEFQMERGFLDAIIPRTELRRFLNEMICSCLANSKVGETEDFICHCFDYFTELKGDRTYRDDQAVIGGIGRINEQFFTIVGIRRGKNIKENVSYNFGMPHPEGYRKSLRLIRQAEKFKRPVICLVDTPGASCDSDSEERGISEAIARNLFELSSVGVPVLSIIIGSGNSGGALALAIANEVWIAEDAYYSVISPEGFASIVWKDSELKKKASEIMEVFPKQLYDLEIVEKIIPIFSDGERNSSNFAYLREKLILFANEYLSLSEQEIINHRYLRYRKF